MKFFSENQVGIMIPIDYILTETVSWGTVWNSSRWSIYFLETELIGLVITALETILTSTPSVSNQLL
jgi:hypothetical protein